MSFHLPTSPCVHSYLSPYSHIYRHIHIRTHLSIHMIAGPRKAGASRGLEIPGASSSPATYRIPGMTRPSPSLSYSHGGRNIISPLLRVFCVVTRRRRPFSATWWKCRIITRAPFHERSRAARGLSFCRGSRAPRRFTSSLRRRRGMVGWSRWF